MHKGAIVADRAFMHNFYRATRMHSADYAVEKCLSVCLSVCLSHAGIVSKRLYISSKFFLTIFTILVFPYQMEWQYFDADPPNGGGASNAMGYKKKSRFSTNISLYLGTDAR